MWVFAHRGESAIYPENSQTAIEVCDNSEMYGIEIDLYQCEDNFVVFHDRWLTRILNIQKTTTSLTPKDLEEIQHRDGKPLPTLQWLIQSLANKGLVLNIELKNIQSSAQFVEQLKAYCAEFQFPHDALVISSFRHDFLQQISELWPEVKLGLLLATHPCPEQDFLPNFPIYSIHLDMDCISTQLIQRCHHLKHKVFVYTVDIEAEIIWLKNSKVDGIFANDPRAAYKTINN